MEKESKLEREQKYARKLNKIKAKSSKANPSADGARKSKVETTKDTLTK